MLMSCSYMDKRTPLGHISAPEDEGDLGAPPTQEPSLVMNLMVMVN